MKESQKLSQTGCSVTVPGGICNPIVTPAGWSRVCRPELRMGGGFGAQGLGSRLESSLPISGRADGGGRRTHCRCPPVCLISPGFSSMIPRMGPEMLERVQRVSFSPVPDAFRAPPGSSWHQSAVPFHRGGGRGGFVPSRGRGELGRRLGSSAFLWEWRPVLCWGSQQTGLQTG